MKLATLPAGTEHEHGVGLNPSCAEEWREVGIGQRTLTSSTISRRPR